jgi:DNA-binding response OmpR family regulator
LCEIFVKSPAPGARTCNPARAHTRGGTVEVLLVEDDDAIALPLTQGLVAAGHTVTRVGTVVDATAAAPHDIVLLDLGLPDGDGLDVARTLRSRGDVPIIVLSARGEEMDRVIGLEVGADDYVVKPFGIREVIARMRAVMRRVATTPTDQDEEADVTAHGRLVVDRARHRVTVDGEEVDVTRKEFGLLALLAEDPGVVYRRETILDRVWDTTWAGTSRTLDAHVASLRRKLGDPSLIETVRGVGYRLGPP